MTWHEHAPCKGMSIDVFFPEELGTPDWSIARAVCASCPATGPDGPCVAEGAELGDWFGFRGGLTPQERAKKAKATCPMCGGPKRAKQTWCTQACRAKAKRERAA